jgi:hypothetical protein
MLDVLFRSLDSLKQLTGHLNDIILQNRNSEPVINGHLLRELHMYWSDTRTCAELLSTHLSPTSQLSLQPIVDFISGFLECDFVETGVSTQMIVDLDNHFKSLYDCLSGVHNCGDTSDDEASDNDYNSTQQVLQLATTESRQAQESNPVHFESNRIPIVSQTIDETSQNLHLQTKKITKNGTRNPLFISL